MLDLLERSCIIFSMNKLDIKQQALILKLLVEGNSLRSTARIADVSRNTVDKLLRDVGEACMDYQDKALRNLSYKRIQCDEIWSFVYSKQKNVPENMKDTFGIGDVWTWVAIDADTKLVPCWHVDTRDANAASRFIDNLAERLANRVQLTTDGHKAYLSAVEDSFGCDVDYGMLVKMYGNTIEGQRRYSPAECTGIQKTKITGNPDEKHLSTSFVERQNLTMRMSIRRFTRLTNAFSVSKKLENHMHAISLHYMFYNFGRIHKSLRVTPAMEAGVTDHVWNIEEILGLIPEEVSKKRGPYKKAA
uniref:DDE domain-containing protein n=1 Tax=Candidatus Kentrum sp. LPFa TaxID=2126335 RepID=A0A450WF41_9GAMM|nr:MAG: DDE domain-containing protein [Candidatus Kentron sp. LPFa]